MAGPCLDWQNKVASRVELKILFNFSLHSYIDAVYGLIFSLSEIMLINTVTVIGIASVGSHMTHWKCIHILFSVGNVLIWFCYSEQNRLNYAHALVKL